MNKDYFKDLYTDFYGVEAGPKFAVKVIRDKDEEDNEVVEEKQEVQTEETTVEVTEETTAEE